MFTGIIGEIGRVMSVEPDGGGIRLTIDAPGAATELNVNDSVSVNGVCQTVIKRSGTRFTMQAVEETLKKTTMGELKGGSSVNLELAVRLNDRLGGHLVQGHVDDIGTIIDVQVIESSWLIKVDFPPAYYRYVVPAGSIAVDGISLTVASVAGSHFTVSIIPHTLGKTTLARAKRGMRVNLEFDLVGKYIEKLIGAGDTGAHVSQVTMEKLKAWGYTI